MEYIKINSKLIKVLNVKPETKKLLEENKRKLSYIGLENECLDLTPKHREQKQK